MVSSVRLVVRFYVGEHSIGVVVHERNGEYAIKRNALSWIIDELGKIGRFIERIIIDKCEDEICTQIASIQVIGSVEEGDK